MVTGIGNKLLQEESLKTKAMILRLAQFNFKEHCAMNNRIKAKDMNQFAGGILMINSKQVYKILGKFPEIRHMEKKQLLNELRKYNDYGISLAYIDRLTKYYQEHKKEHPDTILDNIL